MTNLLCKLGWHKWQTFTERIKLEENRIRIIHTTQCTRCWVEDLTRHSEYVREPRNTIVKFESKLEYPEDLKKSEREAYDRWNERIAEKVAIVKLDEQPFKVWGYELPAEFISEDEICWVSSLSHENSFALKIWLKNKLKECGD